MENNPQSGEIFSDEASYIANAGQNRRERERTEITCQKTYRNQLKRNKALYEALQNSTVRYNDRGNEVDIMFTRIGLDEYIHSMVGRKDVYWIKNQILSTIQESIKNMTYADDRATDLTHNAGKVLRFKRKTDRFFYYKIDLPNGESAYLHFGRFAQGAKDEGKLVLWTITERI